MPHLAVFLSLSLGATALAVPGQLDATFGGDGKVTTNFGDKNDVAIAVAFRADDTILVGGGSFGGVSGQWELASYNDDGSLDTSFGGDGKVTTDFGAGFDWINALAVQDDGKIVAVGGSVPVNGTNAMFALARFNEDGSLDTTFSGDGKRKTNFTSGYDFAEDVVLEPDGNIVVAGFASGAGGKFALARYNLDGTLDTTFGADGKVTTNFDPGANVATGLVLQADGKLVAGGSSFPFSGNNAKFLVARYDLDGTLDSTFSTDGKVTTNFTAGDDHAWDVALQADEKIVLGGRAGGAGGRFGLARYTTDGTLDDTFDGDGKRTTNFNTGSDVATGLAVQDGKIVAAGWSGPANSINFRFAVARYEIDGGLDLTFNGDGKVTTNFTAGNDFAWDMGLQSDGKIVVVGRSAGAGGKFAVARYLSE